MLENYIKNNSKVAIITTDENIDRFKQEGCSVASITNSENCTIAKMSNLNIPYYVQQVKVNYSDITTQLPVLYMIERIGKKLYNQLCEWKHSLTKGEIKTSKSWLGPHQTASED